MELLGMEAFSCSPFLICREQLQPLGPSLSSKGKIPATVNQEQDTETGWKSQETTVKLGTRSWVLLKGVQFSHSVMSDSLWPHGLQHARLCCPSPTLGACSNSCPSVMPSNHLILCHLLIHLQDVSTLPSREDHRGQIKRTREMHQEITWDQVNGIQALTYPDPYQQLPLEPLL